MRLLGTAASGIRTQQTALDTVGNNMANVNTPGYKAERVEFAEALASEIRAAEARFNGALIGERVGIGSGVLYNGITADFSQGTFVQSDSSLDLAVDGEGFFQVVTADGQTAYTRAGAFKIDALGQIVDSNGNFLAVRIPQGTTGLSVDQEGKISGTVNGERRVFGKVVMTNSNGEVVYNPAGPYTVDGQGRLLDGQGRVVPAVVSIPAGAQDVSVGPDGAISGIVNEERQDFATVTLAAFANKEGLEKAGESLYTPSLNSGAPQIGIPGLQAGNLKVGAIRAQALEQSNVNLAQAMTDLIQVQRAYQMNARLLQDGDQMWGLANSLRR